MAKQPLNPVIEQMVFINCLQCKKPIKEGYYARFHGGGVCSKLCMIEHDKKPRFPGHEEEEFLKRFDLG